MKALLLLPICLLAAAPALAGNTIDFEGYPDPTDVTSLSTSGATFTADGSTDMFEISAYTDMAPTGWGTSGPKILCPHTAADGYCSGDFTVTFTGPVTGLEFYFTGDQTANPLDVQAFRGATSLGSMSFIGDGDPFTAQLVNLSGLGMITSIKVTGASADTGGFGYDDFSFNIVPEPTTWAMMLLGLGAIGTVLRRRRDRTFANC